MIQFLAVFIAFSSVLEIIIDRKKLFFYFDFLSLKC